MVNVKNYLSAWGTTSAHPKTQSPIHAVLRRLTTEKYPVFGGFLMDSGKVGLSLRFGQVESFL